MCIECMDNVWVYMCHSGVCMDDYGYSGSCRQHLQPHSIYARQQVGWGCLGTPFTGLWL
jgi:hypothetical protein